MEVLILLAILVFVGWKVFNYGKRLGSKKGFGVGRDRERHRL